MIVLTLLSLFSEIKHSYSYSYSYSYWFFCCTRWCFFCTIMQVKIATLTNTNIKHMWPLTLDNEKIYVHCVAKLLAVHIQSTIKAHGAWYTCSTLCRSMDAGQYLCTKVFCKSYFTNNLISITKSLNSILKSRLKHYPKTFIN